MKEYSERKKIIDILSSQGYAFKMWGEKAERFTPPSWLTQLFIFFQEQRRGM